VYILYTLQCIINKAELTIFQQSFGNYERVEKTTYLKLNCTVLISYIFNKATKYSLN